MSDYVEFTLLPWLMRHLQRVAPSVGLQVRFLVAPSVLAETDLIATLARRIAQAFAQTHGLKLLPLPLELEEFAVRMRWHQSRQGSPADQWLRDQILTVSRQVDDAVADET